MIAAIQRILGTKTAYVGVAMIAYGVFIWVLENDQERAMKWLTGGALTITGRDAVSKVEVNLAEAAAATERLNRSQNRTTQSIKDQNVG